MLDTILLATPKKSDGYCELIFNLREIYDTNYFFYKLTDSNDIKIIFSMYFPNQHIKPLYIPFYYQNIKIEECWKAKK